MKSNTLTIIIITIVLGAGAYWYVTSQSGNEAPLSTSTEPRSASQTQFQTLVSQLQSISFNTDIFSDPNFSSLENIAVPIIPESSGRLDPFAPLQGVAGI